MAAKKVSKIVRKTAARSVKPVDNNTIVEKGREVWLASIGAAVVARKKGEQLVKSFETEAKTLRKKATKLVTGLRGDVFEQAQGVLAQVKSATTANVGWVSEKVEDTMGKVLTKVGVPTKSDISELTRRVDALQKQVRAMKKAA